MNSHKNEKRLTLNDLMTCDLSNLPKLSDRYMAEANNEREAKNTDGVSRSSSSSDSGDHIKKFILSRISPYNQMSVIALSISVLLSTQYDTLNILMPDSGTLVDFANLVVNEQILKDLMQFSHQLVMRLKDKNMLSTVTTVTPDAFQASYKESLQEPLSFEEVKLMENRKKKEMEKILREETKEERQSLIALSITQEMKERNLAEQAQKIETRKQELLERFKNMSSRRQAVLKSLLNPEVSADQQKETVVINTLESMGLFEKTDKGYKVPFVASTHRDHGDGKVDGHFIAELRKYFLEHGITTQNLKDIIKTEQNAGPQNGK